MALDNLSDNFDRQFPKHIDADYEKPDIAGMFAIPLYKRYPGMTCWVVNENAGSRLYVLDAGNGDDLSDNSLWKPLLSDVNNINNSKGIIYGGAEWSGTGLIFNVSEIKYNYYGFIGIIPPTTKTLDDGDAENRFDIVAANTDTNEIVIIKGTPSPDPIFPEIAEELISIQAISVMALATTPAITQTIVYRNNVEWVMSTLGAITGTIVSNATDTPYLGSTIIRVDACNRNAIVVLTDSPLVEYSDFPLLTLRVRVKSSIPSNVQFMLRNRKNGSNSGSAVNLMSLGFNPLLVNSWQLIAVPTSLFSAPNGNGLSFQMIHGSTALSMSWDLDNIVFSDGEAPPPPSTNFPEAPIDGIIYGRKDAAWTPVETIISETIQTSEYIQQIAYVDDLTGNDTTGEVNDPLLPFKTIKAGVDSLTSAICSVRIGEGVYTCPEEVLQDIDSRVQDLSIESRATTINATESFVEATNASLYNFAFYGGLTDIVAGASAFKIEGTNIYSFNLVANNVFGEENGLVIIHPGFNNIVLNGNCGGGTDNGYGITIRDAANSDIFIRGNITCASPNNYSNCVQIRDVKGNLNITWGGIIDTSGLTHPASGAMDITNNNTGSNITLRGDIVDSKPTSSNGTLAFEGIGYKFGTFTYIGDITTTNGTCLRIVGGQTDTTKINMVGRFISLAGSILSVSGSESNDISFDLLRGSSFKGSLAYLGGKSKVKFNGHVKGIATETALFNFPATIPSGIEVNIDDLTYEASTETIPLIYPTTVTSGTASIRVNGALRTNSTVAIPTYAGLEWLTDITASSGGGGDFIPLSGTEVGNPVTGDIELGSSVQIFQGVTDYQNWQDMLTSSGFRFVFGDWEGFVGLLDGEDGSPYMTYYNNVTDEWRKTDSVGLSIKKGSIYIALTTNPDNECLLVTALNGTDPGKGIDSNEYYGANYTDNTYVQKKYVDDEIKNIVEENIIGTAVYNAAMTGSVNLDLSTFASLYGILTGNTTITVTNTPASGESFVRSIKLKSTATETLTLPVSWEIVGEYVADGTVNDLQIEFSNYPTEGLIVWCYINQTT